MFIHLDHLDDEREREREGKKKGRNTEMGTKTYRTVLSLDNFEI